MNSRRVDNDGHGAGPSSATRGVAANPLPVSSRSVIALLALLPTAAATLYRVLLNAPGGLPGDLTALGSGTLSLLVVGPALAAFVFAATVDAAAVRIGLAFVGGFGLLSVVSPAAWLPAAVGVVAGCGLVVGGRVARLASAQFTALATPTVGVVLAAAVVTSLAATAGVAAPTLRPVGSWLALLGLASTPLLSGVDRLGVLAGAVAGVGTVALATSVPYVAGAVFLVGGGVVGVPLGLVALAVGGGVAAGVVSIRRGRLDRALGVGVLLAAGVPGTLFRAVAVGVAVALLVVSRTETPPRTVTTSGGASA